MNSIEKLLVSDINHDFTRFINRCIEQNTFKYQNSEDCQILLKKLSKYIFYKNTNYPDGVSITKAPFKLVSEELIDSLFLTFLITNQKQFINMRINYTIDLPNATDSITDKINKMNILRNSPLAIIFFINYLREYFYKNMIDILNELKLILEKNDINNKTEYKDIKNYWTKYYLTRYNVIDEWNEINTALSNNTFYNVKYYKAINMAFLAIMLFDNNRNLFKKMGNITLIIFNNGVKIMNEFINAHSYSMNLININNANIFKDLIDMNNIINKSLDGILYNNYYFTYNIFLNKYYYGKVGTLLDMFKMSQYFTLSRLQKGELSNDNKNQRWILRGFEPVHSKELGIFTFEELKNKRFYWRNIVDSTGNNKQLVNRQLIKVDNKNIINIENVMIIETEMKLNTEILPILRVDVNRMGMYAFFSLPYSYLSNSNKNKPSVKNVTHYFVRLCDKKIIGIASNNYVSFPGMTYTPQKMPQLFIHISKCIPLEFVLFILCIIRELIIPIGKKKLTKRMVDRLQKLFKNKLNIASGISLDSDMLGYLGAQLVNKSECVSTMSDKMKEQYLYL